MQPLRGTLFNACDTKSRGHPCQICVSLSAHFWVSLLIPSYSHLILEPVIGKDVVHDKRLYSRRRRPFRLGLNPAFEFRCKRCPELPIYKLWEMSALTLHLRTKYGLDFSSWSCNSLLFFSHYILDPIEGDDWTRVVIIAAAAANNDSVP